MKVTSGFNPGDRYAYDFGPCSYRHGWAQLDSKQDASYYGNWVNPTSRKLFSYVEGDTTLIECETDDEFVQQVRQTITWHNDHGYGPSKIDVEHGTAMHAEFIRLGLADTLYGDHGHAA